MKKIICVMLCIVMLFGLTVPCLAATPVISSHPSDVFCNEGDYIAFSAVATGDYIWCRWFLEIDNVAYDLGGDLSSYPWIDEVGYDHGAYNDGNTYYYYFQNPTLALNGAKIYARFNENEMFADTQKATINVVSSLNISVPEYIDTYRGEIVDIYCSASDPSGGKLEYLWYSSPTEDMSQITAINRGTETYDTLRVNTDNIGVTFYCCLVTSSSGKSEYSPMTRIIVYDRPGSEVEAPQITTATLPDATVGEEYYVKLDCTDGDASFSIYDNPGKENTFSLTGLLLTQHGEIEGVPVKAGTYSFTIKAAGEGGEDYVIFSLTVKEPAQTTAATTAATTTLPATTTPATTLPATTTPPATTEAITEPQETTAPATEAQKATTAAATEENSAAATSSPVTSSPITLESTSANPPAVSAESTDEKEIPTTDHTDGPYIPTIGASKTIPSKLIIIICVAVLGILGAVALAGIAVLVIILIKKKKKK